MKHFKSIMALACVATMMASTVTAFAETSDPNATTPVTGGSIVENDNSTLPDYSNIVLPTYDSADNTYDFTIDPQHLLNKYDSTNYGKDATVFFTKLTGYDTLTVTQETGYDTDLYTLSYSEVTADKTKGYADIATAAEGALATVKPN